MKINYNSCSNKSKINYNKQDTTHCLQHWVSVSLFRLWSTFHHMRLKFLELCQHLLFWSVDQVTHAPYLHKIINTYKFSVWSTKLISLLIYSHLAYRKSTGFTQKKKRKKNLKERYFVHFTQISHEHQNILSQLKATLKFQKYYYSRIAATGWLHCAKLRSM